MSVIALLAIPLIIVGGSLVAVGVMGSMGSTYISAGHTSNTYEETHSLRDKQNQPHRKSTVLKIGLTVLAAGVLLLLLSVL